MKLGRVRDCLLYFSRLGLLMLSNQRLPPHWFLAVACNQNPGAGEPCHPGDSMCVSLACVYEEPECGDTSFSKSSFLSLIKNHFNQVGCSLYKNIENNGLLVSSFRFCELKTSSIGEGHVRKAAFSVCPQAATFPLSPVFQLVASGSFLPPLVQVTAVTFETFCRVYLKYRHIYVVVT